uniref:4'-phosphopantetheinyl transferase n=1 Tax=uncultured Acidobacteria bacterium A3 TaxID=1036853 RepID=F8TTH7_9BACT|nr:4'-phosphopantetheinyl transferase [uncultured Acidobacteria bacterium A3]
MRRSHVPTGLGLDTPRHLVPSPPPPLLIAEPGEVHIWWASLDLDWCAVTDLVDLLSAAERSRAAQIYRHDARRRSIVSRALLRIVLARYTGCAPADVDLDRNGAGKPHLAGGDGRLAFNVSHASDKAVIAVTWDTSIGVDLEPGREIDDAVSVAERTLPRALAAYVRRGSTVDVSARFARAWTVFEAQQKLRGVGLTDEQATIHRGACHTECLAMPDGFIAAVAFDGPPRRLQCYDAAQPPHHAARVVRNLPLPT